MDIDPILVEIRCLFCDSVLQCHEGLEFKSGDLIECICCGEGNDYESVVEVAKEKGVEKITGLVKAQLEKEFKKMLK